MQQVKTTRVLGIADYEARWVHNSFLVELTATGVLPCDNYEAQIEQRPEKVLPPMWDMVFYIQTHCAKRLKPFIKKVLFVNTTGPQSIFVRDASGENEVPIQQAFEATTEGSRLDIGSTQDHIVYAKLPRSGSGHCGCIVVPEGSLVTAIHYRAFGPAPKEECDRFVLQNCGPLAADWDFRAGEIPWPLQALE